MGQPYIMQQSRAIPVDVDTAFAVTLPISLSTVFSRWYGPIAPVKAVHDQTGEWGTVGQTRTVTQVGGGSMREELTRVDPPHAFAYTLTRIAGPMAPLLSTVEGKWLFAPGAGMRGKASKSCPTVSWAEPARSTDAIERVR